MRKKNSFMKFIMTMIFLGMIAAGAFLFLSPQFEQDAPIVDFKTDGYWNLKNDLEITLKDKSGIKYYKVTFIDGSKELILSEKILFGIDKTLSLHVSPPKLDMFYKGTNVKVKIDVIDNSKWNFLNGNSTSRTYDIKIDNKKPIANVINNSRYIKRGGSALIVVKVKDDNLKDAYITFNRTHKFKLLPFYRENYYIALIAWDVNVLYDDFDRVNLVAIDKAGNKTISKVPLYIQKLIVKKDKIRISKKYISKVSHKVLKNMGHEIPEDPEDVFISQNNDLRAQNIKTIKQVVMENFEISQVDSFNVNRFRRLRGSITAAGYAEKRSYYFEGDKIDEQWHLGMDWASVKRAAIKTSNSGKVIYNSYLGIYGNTIIVDHGMGLSSLYAHTTSQYVSVGDEINKNKKIASTGTSGAVMGDHLHFGILIQGIEVDPVEWMDRNWIKNRITNIIKSSKKIIKSDNL